ncbi:MAG: acyltransferase, partial [Phormidesmis sp.]
GGDRGSQGHSSGSQEHSSGSQEHSSGSKRHTWRHTWFSFMLKRCLRIYPFYWLVNLAVMPLYLLMPTAGTSDKREFAVILKSFLLVPQLQSPILVVAWFLSYILLFYAVFGLLIALQPKVSLPIITSWLVLSVLFNLRNYIAGTGGGPANFFWPHFFLSLYGIEFAAGGLMAFWLTSHRLKRAECNAFFTYGAIAFIVFGLIDNYVLNGNNSFMMQGYEFAAYGVTSVFLIGGIAASESEANRFDVPPSLPVKWLLQSPTWIGAASYAILLTHYLVLSLGVKVLARLNLNAVQLNIGGIFCCLLACLVGWLSHRYVERPCVRLASLGVQRLQRGADTRWS